MDTYKVIFSGRLEFGNPKSFGKVLKMYQHRMENYYKNEIILNWEDVFIEDASALNVPRLIAKASNKWWKNTVNLLEYVAQYAVAGDLSVWMVEQGKILKYRMIEPQGDKVAVQSFLKGRELVNETGKEEEAKLALSRAIEKFARHAKAYERRGYVNYHLGNYEDAIYDYSKSIDINPNGAESYQGRAWVLVAQNKYEEAIEDLVLCIKKSIPLQPMYWQARRLKAECLIKMNDFEGAAQDLRLFTKREFTPENPNYKWRRSVWFKYGKTLMQLKDHQAAAEAFDQAMKLEDLAGNVSDAELLLYRGMAFHEAGQNGYRSDWEAAANKGSERAAALLAEVTV